MLLLGLLDLVMVGIIVASVLYLRLRRRRDVGRIADGAAVYQVIDDRIFATTLEISRATGLSELRCVEILERLSTAGLVQWIPSELIPVDPDERPAHYETVQLWTINRGR